MSYKPLSDRTYRKKLVEFASCYLNIRPCMKCGSPVVCGYCCMFCGDTNPDQTKEQEESLTTAST